jgi:NmrA-like family
VNALLADGTFTPWTVSRDPYSEAAKKLKARGAEVVKADLWDAEFLKTAITGSEGVFGVSGGMFSQCERLLTFSISRSRITGTSPFSLPTRRARWSRVETSSMLARR